MNIDHIKLFIRISEVHNISKAGRDLGISAAVASDHINKLEKSLSTRLIHRTTRKVSLTEDGLAFLPYAEEVLNSVESAKNALGGTANKPSGTLRISAPASFGRMHVLPAIPEFLAQYPKMKIDLRLSDSIIDLVEGGFDVAIRNSQLTDSGLVARKLANDRRVLCASPDYLKSNGAVSKPEDLAKHNCLALMELNTWTFKYENSISKIKVGGNFRTDNGEAIRDLTCAALGISANSTWSVYNQLLSGELVQVLPEYSLLTNTAIWAVYPSTRQLSAKVRVFIDYFVAKFGKTPYWDRLEPGQPLIGPTKKEAMDERCSHKR